MEKPMLTLAMIVRDEAEMLPAFLERVDGLWDELAVVDTGSTDNTVAILERAGATVQNLEWNNDFSEARNASLAMANGEWILILDADEMMSPELAAEIRDTMASDEIGAATVVMRDRMDMGQVRESSLLRLFRNRECIEFNHRIHEDAAESIQQMLASEGLQLTALKGVVDHLGYSRERAEAKGKKARDLQLLEETLQEDPLDIYSHYKRLELARFWRDGALYRQAGEDALAALDEVDEESLSMMQYGGPLIAALADAQFGTDTRRAIEWMDQWTDKVIATSEFYYWRGQLQERDGDFEAAKGDYNCALALGTHIEDPYGMVRPTLGLCRLALHEKDVDRAQELATQALRANPKDPEALLIGIVLSRHKDGDEGAEGFITSYTAEHGENYELWLAAAEEAGSRRDKVSRCEALGKAYGLQPEGPTAIPYAMSLLATSRLDECRTLCSELVEAHPTAGLGVLVCNMAEEKSTDIIVDLTEDEAAQSMRAWTDAVVESGDPDSVITFARMCNTVEAVFPWLLDYVREQIEEQYPSVPEEQATAS